MVEKPLTPQDLAPLLSVSDRTVRNAYRRALRKDAGALPKDERDRAFLDASTTPGGRPRWSRKAAARILRAHGCEVPEAWGDT